MNFEDAYIRELPECGYCRRTGTTHFVFLGQYLSNALTWACSTRCIQELLAKPTKALR